VAFKSRRQTGQMSAVRRIEFKAEPLAVLTDGKTVEGEIAAGGRREPHRRSKSPQESEKSVQVK